MKIRRATINDISKIVEMLADDELGKARENYQLPLPQEYIMAFEKIDVDHNQELSDIQQQLVKLKQNQCQT